MKKPFFAIALSALASTAFAQQEPIQFTARSIVALSDADLTASSLIDNNLYRDRGSRDAITVITLPLTRTSQINSLQVSNSMLLSDKALGVTNNGKLAFVLEGRGPLGDSIPTLKNGVADLPASNAMFVVDVTANQKPSTKFKIPTGGNLSALALTPQGNAMVVASGDAGKELKIIDIDASGKPTRILTSASPTPGQQITDLVFHPGGQFVAYSIAATQEVGLLKYAIDNATKKPYLLAHGKPIKVGALPGSGRFTTDGGFFVIADAKKPISASGAGAGELFVVKFSTEDTPGEHTIVSQAATGESPEAVAISPDGSVVVVSNSGQSYQPFTNAAVGKSSLSVYALGKDGKLTKGDDYAFEGIMPQAVAFDRTGDALVVGVSEYVDFGGRTGGLEFWKVTKGDKPTLTKQPGRINVARGVHSIRVVN
ncbi:MAG: beta-propeller fold lactonase family protein [Bacteroidetes bacterium]|nr:beta-propeller fold lactonase family protein [Fibrella sp.]